MMAPEPTAIASILRTLLRCSKLDEAGFVRDFSRRMNVDRRTPIAWLQPIRDGRSHLPTRDNLERLTQYFASRLNCPELSTELFYQNEEQFAQSLATIIEAKTAPSPVPPQTAMPFAADSLPDDSIQYLCGTYRVYRYSLTGTQNLINCDLLLVERSSGNESLTVTLYCLPAHGKRHLQSSEDSTEIFSGRMWKFGQSLICMMLCSNDMLTNRRARHMHFPVPTTQTTVHYGLITGYSTTLAEPVAARALAIKISHEDVTKQELSGKHVRSMSVNDPEVRDVARLLNNHIADDINVLTVDRKLSLEV
jgi:hypothetical protein